MTPLELIRRFYFAYDDLSWDDGIGVCLAFLFTIYFFRPNAKDPNHHLWFERPQAHLSKKITTAENDIAKVLRESGQDIVVFYGTQAGTSQRLAQNLGQAIDRRFSRKVCVASLSDYNSASIAAIDRKALLIFILSTYGEGDPPDNAVDFAEWLRSDLPSSCLAGLRFAMLGVGSSNYKWFNNFSKAAFDLLRGAGAIPALDVYFADDAQGMVDEGYFIWTTELFRVMVDHLDMPEKPRTYEPALDVCVTGDLLSGEGPHVPTQEHYLKGTRDNLSPFRPLRILELRHLAESADRPFIHLDIDISKYPELKYVTGDHIALWPENEDSEVYRLCERLGISHLDMHKRLKITQARPTAIWNPVWDKPVTIHSLFKVYLEIAAPVSRELIQVLKEFAPSVSAKDFLQSVSIGMQEYKEYRLSKRITLASVLEDACSDRPWPIPISFILERVAALKPRCYSISSAASVQPRRVSITVRVMTLQLGSAGEIVRGLTSHYLSASQCPGGRESESGPEKRRTIFGQIRKSTFRLPASPTRPIIMISTGSGIAPFRGFIQHVVKQAKLGRQTGQLILLFGCRNRQEHLYRDEFEAASESLGSKLLRITAYSRSAEGKCYVQDKIKQEQDLMGRLLLDEDASVYICGSSAMARGVNRALSEILCQRRKWTPEQFTIFESDMKRLWRWQEDVWG